MVKFRRQQQHLFACHRCGERGHFRSQCKALKLAAGIEPKVEEAKVEKVEEAKVEKVEEAKLEKLEKEEKVEAKVAEELVCKWCCELTHASKMCRRFKTRLCVKEECTRGEDCPYAHSTEDLRNSIWFHTELCTAAEHTAECRRAFAHTEDERWNALSALIAIPMVAAVLR